MTLLRPTGTRPENVRRFDMLPIQSDIPVPVPDRLPRGVILNTLKAMRAGDSFTIRRQSKASVYARSKETGIKVRMVEERPGVWRVWRLS